MHMATRNYNAGLRMWRKAMTCVPRCLRLPKVARDVPTCIETEAISSREYPKIRMVKKTYSHKASYEIPAQHGFEGLGSNTSDDEDWEVIETGKKHREHGDTASDPTSALTWRFKFSLQPGAESNKPENYDGKMSIAPYKYATSVQEQTQSRLFSLAIELRLRIYEQLLSLKSTNIQLKWYSPSHRRSLPPSVLSILETCRRIHAEAEPIFYSVNHFQYPFENAALVTGFFQTISLNRRRAIRSLTVSVSSASEALFRIQELDLLPQLQKLQIKRKLSIRYIEIRAWVVLAKQLKMELEKLGELRELEIVTPEAATLSPVEEERMRRLKQIDALLQEVTSERSQASRLSNLPTLL